ncbi:porin [Roseateles sp. BYS180W]|uniref:Porin n=1 Tax=Roseateles rivi TaxID=3299028 RepID=A0ABW7FUT8_9BURK
MKKLAIAAAVAALAAPAFAQSSVTLWGRVNTSVESQKEGTGDRKVVVQDNRSRLGLKGVEDLGGGLKASFELEHGFDADTGKQTNTAFWNRQASIQLAGDFGAVRLGRWTPGSYFATADYVSLHNHDTGTSSDALYSGAGFTETNKIGYFLPTIAGVTGEVAIHLGEGQEKRGLDAALNYDLGALHLGAGYSKQDNANQWALRGLYELGAFTFGGYYQQESVGGSKRKVVRLSGMYTLDASEFHINYGVSSGTNDFASYGSKPTQLTLGYNYNLSKRTKLYAFLTEINAKKNAHDFSSLAVGVRHNF